MHKRRTKIICQSNKVIKCEKVKLEFLLANIGYFKQYYSCIEFLMEVLWYSEKYSIYRKQYFLDNS